MRRSFIGWMNAVASKSVSSAAMRARRADDIERGDGADARPSPEEGVEEGIGLAEAGAGGNASDCGPSLHGGYVTISNHGSSTGASTCVRLRCGHRGRAPGWPTSDRARRPPGPPAAGDLFDEILPARRPRREDAPDGLGQFRGDQHVDAAEDAAGRSRHAGGAPPNQVRLVYAGADARTVIVNGNTLALDWPARTLKETRDIGGTMRRAERFFVMSSPAELRKHFDIVAVEAPDRAGAWRVTFTPKRAQMREGVSRVHLWIDQASLGLHALEMEYPGGDTRLMEFSDVRINPPVDADAFAVAARR